MAAPRAFVSFDFDHNESEKYLFIGQASNSKTPFEIADWSSKSSLPQSQWEHMISQKISRTNMLIVLVGRHMATATGVAKEIAFARSHDVPIFGVYVDSANALSALPAGLARERVIAWKWVDISDAIAQVMREGKNGRVLRYA